MGFFMFDSYFIILILPALIFSFYAQYKVKSTFNKYQKQRTATGKTGADIARELLDNNGLSDVSIENVPGQLSDHYDPRKRVVRLSASVYGNSSVAAAGVAAHETGHAIQHKEGYLPLVLRSTLVPAAGIGSSFGPWMTIFGLIFSNDFLLNVGIILFSVAVLFYIVTLPVEFNASSRAIYSLERDRILAHEEIIPVKKVLNAAAMTYVASAAVALASLLRLLLLRGRR